jgi:hypothetical protein
MNLLATELSFDAGKQHVLYIGYIINLIAHKVLFSSDVESFEEELEASITTELVSSLVSAVRDQMVSYITSSGTYYTQHSGKICSLACKLYRSIRYGTNRSFMIKSLSLINSQSRRNRRFNSYATILLGGTAGTMLPYERLNYVM